jgi:DNA repair exonuclease SbcCD ATPase subunit
MKIQFDFINIEGFRSIINFLAFNLNKPGLNLIKGVNGAGKTSIFEALIWVLYGTNLKESNNDKLPSWPENRTSQWQGTRVSLTFHKDSSTFCVIRHIAYKGLTEGVKGEDYLMLLKDGKMIGDFRNKSEMQQEINRILGIDSNTFSNSVLFGQRIAKLIQQDNKDKRELFETLFETEWVPAMKLKADADIKQWESDLLKLGWDINKSLTEIEHLTDKLSTAKATLAGFEENRGIRLGTKEVLRDQYTNRLVELNKELGEYTESLSAIKYDAETHGKLNDEFENLEKQFNEANLAQVTHAGKLQASQNALNTQTFNVNKLQEDLDNLTAKHIEGNCPYCEQELKAGNKLEINHNKDLFKASEKVKAAKIARKEAETTFKALQKVKAPATPESITKAKEEVLDKLTVMDALLVDVEKFQEYIRDTNADIVQAKKDLCRVMNEIEGIKAEKAPVVNLSQLEVSIDMNRIELELLQQEKPVLEKKIEIAKWWSSKALGAGGVKAYVFTAMLGTLNQCVKKYGDRLGASLEFSIDLSKASKPFYTKCSLGDKLDKDYNSFSGGEKDRLDICLMFGLYDVISMNSDMNLLIMDEPFAGLDEEGEAIVFDLMREKTETGKSVYVITHSATLDSLYANKIEFTKEFGNTLILN